MTWLVLIRTPYEEMVKDYKFTEREALQYLIRLDRLKVIELQPGNRVRLLVSRHFSWRLGWAGAEVHSPEAAARVFRQRLCRHAGGILLPRRPRNG